MRLTWKRSPRIRRLVEAPGPIHAIVCDRLVPAGRLQPVHDLLHVLRVVAVHRQHGVLGDHDHRVLQPDHGGQHAVAADVAVARVLQQHVADRDIAGGVLAPEVPQRAPAADIGPADIGRHHGGAAGLLGHRVVEADRGAGGERLDAEPDEVEVGPAFGHRAAHRVQHVGRVGLQLFEQRARGEHEHARVPQMLAVGRQAFRRRGVGLFDEVARPHRRPARRRARRPSRCSRSRSRARSGACRR